MSKFPNGSLLEKHRTVCRGGAVTIVPWACRHNYTSNYTYNGSVSVESLLHHSRSCQNDKVCLKCFKPLTHETIGSHLQCDKIDIPIDLVSKIPPALVQYVNDMD